MLCVHFPSQNDEKESVVNFLENDFQKEAKRAA